MSNQEPAETDPNPELSAKDSAQWINHVMPFVVWMMAMQLLSNAGAWNYAARTALGVGALLYWKPWQFNYRGPAMKHLIPGVLIGIVVFAFWVIPETPWFTQHWPHLQNIYLTWFTQDVAKALGWTFRSVAFGEGGLMSVLPPLVITALLAVFVRPWHRPFDPVSIVSYVIAAACWVVFLSSAGANIPFIGPMLAETAGEFPWVTIADADTESQYHPATCGWLWTMFRIVGSAFVISIIEEFFWRGWMYRWIVKEPFHSVGIDTLKWSAVIGAAVFFSLVHHRWLAALACGICYTLLMIKSRNIWPAVIAHTITNLLLGLYVIIAEQYRFWA